MIIEVPEKYKTLYTTDKPIILITGGRGSGKSFQSNLFTKRLSYEKGHVILHTRYTMDSAEKSIIPEFTEKIDLENDHKYFRVTKKEIYNKLSGSKIIFSGIKTSSGNQTANLKSIQGLTTFLVDEGEEWVQEDEFLKIRGSIRTKGIKNRIIIVMNPSDIEHWVYKMFIENTNRIIQISDDIGTYDVEVSTHPDVEHIHTTYLDNIEHLNESFEKFRQNIIEYNADRYGNIVMGAWERQTEGVLFPINELKYFNPNEKYEFETSMAYGDIADEGTDSTAIPFGRNIGKTIYITDVLFNKLLSDVTIPLAVQKIKEQGCNYIRIESNNMGAMYGRNLRAQVEGFCDVYGATSTTNKHTRIMNEVGFIKRHCRFIEPEYQSDEYRRFMDELCTYNIDPKLNKGKHDDAPDALSGLCLFIRGYLMHLYF